MIDNEWVLGTFYHFNAGLISYGPHLVRAGGVKCSSVLLKHQKSHGSNNCGLIESQ